MSEKSSGAALAFLGTYPAAGAFFDLVRPDSVALGLAAWSIVLALQPRRGAPIAAGLLLAAAFLCKHNFALFGFPLALGLFVRRPLDAVAFVLASAVPAGLATLLLQAQTDGHFLTYLLEVPRTHEILWGRATHLVPAELGTALPLGVAAIGWSLYLRPFGMPGGFRPWLPTWATATIPMWVGIAVAWFFTYFPPPEHLARFPTAMAWWAVVAGTLGVGLRCVEGWRGRRQGLATGRIDWKVTMGLGVGATAIAMSLVMRAHDGGFLNVLMPALWGIAFALGIVLHRLLRHPRWGHLPATQVLVALAIAGQLGWSAARIDRDDLVPTAEDRAVGDAFVAAARDIEGPILSPFAAWIPVYAGKPPAIHAMALWDLDRPHGPYVDDLRTIRDAMRDDYWVLAFGGTHSVVGPLTDHFEPIQDLTDENGAAFVPKTGMPAHPWRTMAPILGVE